MASVRNLKELEDLQKDPSAPCLAAPRNVRLFSIAWGNVRVFSICWLNVHQHFRRNDGEGVNVAEEAFPHDRRKCIEAQQAMMDTFYLDLVLPGHDSVNTTERPQSQEGKTDSHRFDLIEQEDLLTSEFSDRMEAPTQRKSPLYSPIGQDTLPSSPVGCKSKDVEFVLKQENDLRS